jgi:hypothetical protein
MLFQTRAKIDGRHLKFRVERFMASESADKVRIVEQRAFGSRDEEVARDSSSNCKDQIPHWIDPEQVITFGQLNLS